MTEIRNIVAGPSQWDVMLSLFEDKEVILTFDKGDPVTFVIDTVYDNKGADKLLQPGETTVTHSRGDGWLIKGWPISTRENVDKDIYEVWAEYSFRTRTGICVLVPESEYDEKVTSSFMPIVWRRAMGIPEDGWV